MTYYGIMVYYTLYIILYIVYSLHIKLSYGWISSLRTRIELRHRFSTGQGS